mgnify:CR=1 FL=1
MQIGHLGPQILNDSRYENLKINFTRQKGLEHLVEFRSSGHYLIMYHINTGLSLCVALLHSWPTILSQWSPLPLQTVVGRHSGRRRQGKGQGPKVGVTL